MKSRLYIESTIPSYLTAREPKTQRGKSWVESTNEFWNHYLQNYDCYVSETVINEVSRGESAMAMKRLQAISGAQTLPGSPEVDSLADHLVSVRLVPEDVADDALHIAYAAVYGCDFLLTWNLKHIHNPQIYRRLEAACRGFGFVPPVIVTPDELLVIHSHEDSI